MCNIKTIDSVFLLILHIHLIFRSPFLLLTPAIQRQLASSAFQLWLEFLFDRSWSILLRGMLPVEKPRSCPRHSRLLTFLLSSSLLRGVCMNGSLVIDISVGDSDVSIWLGSRLFVIPEDQVAEHFLHYPISGKILP